VILSVYCENMQSRALKHCDMCSQQPDIRSR